MAWFQLMPTMCEMQPFSACRFSDRNCLENVMFCLNYQQTVAKCFETKKPPEWVTEHNKKSISLERGVFIGHRHTWREGYNEGEKNSRLRTAKGKGRDIAKMLWARQGQKFIVSQETVAKRWIWKHLTFGENEALWELYWDVKSQLKLR